MKRKFAVSCMLLVLFIGIINITSEAKQSNEPARKFANIVLFAHFSGDNAQADAQFFANPENRNKIVTLYNGDHGRSVKSYLNTVSYGKFQIQNILPQDDGSKIISCQVSVTEKQAQEKNVDSQIIQEVISKVPDVKNQIVDYDGDGVIDNLTVIMKGEPPKGSSSVVPTMVSHKSDFPDSNTKYAGKSIGTYNMISTGSILGYDNRIPQESGVIIHEFLHSLGYPDLYRGNMKDSSEPSEQPVSIWDIMANATYRVAYPLAYIRMKYTNWLDIETVKNSTSLTLDTQDKADGNQAYILQSPLNEHELFVVEYRKRGERDYTTEYGDSLDASLINDKDSGVIVYRVNTTVTGLSNYYGQTGIYVFRPQKGQNGYVENNEASTVHNAALSDENGRTTIGQEDLSKKLADGALTFSNGTNSGIVISNVKRNGNNQMTLDVTIPDASNFDLWKDTGFADGSTSTNDTEKNAAITTCNGTQYLAVYNSVSYGKGKFQLYNYKGNGWSAIGSSIDVNGIITDKKLLSYKNEIYLAYTTTEQKLYVKKCNLSGAWTDILTQENIAADFSIEETAGEIYLTYLSGGGSKAVLGKIENNKYIQIGEYYVIDSAFLAQPKVCELNEKIYVSVKDVIESKIKIFRYDGNSAFTGVDNGLSLEGSYDIAVLDGKLYLSRGPKLNIISYDGKNWGDTKNSDIPVFEPSLTVTQGNLYILVSDPNAGTGSSIDKRNNTKVYQYNTQTGEYIQEGADVDSPAWNLTLTSSENKLFISYVRSLDYKVVVKTKNTADELLSLTIVPPEKISYFAGDKVDTSGMTVTANYTKGSRQIGDGAYKITGFDTTMTGQRIATVSYGGKENTFYYEVLENHVHDFTEWETIESACQGSFKERTCKTCGYKQTEGYDESKHNWTESVVEEATCTKNGSKKEYCTGCNIVKSSVTIPALGHKFGSFVSDKNGTCIKDGTKTAKCERCGEKQTVNDAGSKKAHNYKSIVKKATVTKDGSIVNSCSICGTTAVSSVIYRPKTISLSNSSFTYNGKQQTPSVDVRDSKGKRINAANYIVTFSGERKAIGRYTVSVSFKGNYSGTVQQSYTITPKGTKLSKVSSGKRKLTVKWKAQKKDINGYQVQYSTKKSFGSQTKTKNISKRKKSVKLSRLKSKKKYYVRIRTYKTVKVNGKSEKIYSGWSKSKAAKVK